MLQLADVKLIHQQWALVGTVLVVDEDGNAVPVGNDKDGNPVKPVTISVPVERFRGNEFAGAFGQARVACEQLLASIEQRQGPTVPLDDGQDDDGIEATDTTGDVQ